MRRLALFSLLAAFSIFLFSCSDNEPKVISTSGYMLLDFQDEESLPTQRLAIFVETSSDVHRAETLTVTSRNNDFQWKCDNPVIFSNDRRQWAGCVEFVSPYNTQIPDGLYDVKYIDAQEKEFASFISVNYSKDFLNLKASEVVSKISGRYREQIAVYTSENTLCYYGDIKESWKDEKKIFTSNTDSAWYRKTISVVGSNLICLMPPVTKAEVEARAQALEKQDAENAQAGGKSASSN